MPPAGRDQIFICYRREDSPGHSGRIHDALAERFGRRLVFQDIRIPPGVDWKHHIDSTLNGCAVVVVVIGKGWLCERLKQRDDLLRHELEVALKRDIAIPILVDETPLPRRMDLPPALKGLVDKQALWIRNDAYHHGLEILIGRVRDILAQRKPPPRPMRASLISPVGWVLAILAGLANYLLQAAWWKAAGVAAVVFATWVAADRYFGSRNRIRPA